MSIEKSLYELPQGLEAINEASKYQDEDKKINQGETTIILVPVNQKPELIKQ